MDRPAAHDEIFARHLVTRGVANGHPSGSRHVRSNVPDQLPVLPGESDLILEHIGDALANIFDP